MWITGRIDWEFTGETGRERANEDRNGIGLEGCLVS